LGLAWGSQRVCQLSFPLSVAGASFQAILRNPLAEPYILGISSGGALGAVLSILLGVGSIAFLGLEISVAPLFAFAGCLGTMALVYALAFGGGSHMRHGLILTGVIVGAFLSAFVLFFTSLVRFDRLQSVIYWMMGNLNRPLEPVSLLPLAAYVLIGCAILFMLARSFNTLAFGDETARALGTDPVKTRRYAFIAASLVVSAAVSATGLVGFVGLIVPHATRLLFGSDNRLLLPASFLFGAAFLVAADAVARVIIKNQQLPVGVITALCGAPVFLILMRARMRKSYFS
jgi:iron complex transport system permease protein